MTTVSGTNIDEIPDIIDTVVKAKANVFAFARYWSTSEEKDINIDPLRYLVNCWPIATKISSIRNERLSDLF